MKTSTHTPTQSKALQRRHNLRTLAPSESGILPLVPLVLLTKTLWIWRSSSVERDKQNGFQGLLESSLVLLGPASGRMELASSHSHGREMTHLDHHPDILGRKTVPENALHEKANDFEVHKDLERFREIGS